MNWFRTRISRLKSFQSSKPPAKSFSAWQIELTTRCPLQCRMCPREGTDPWLPGDMKLEDFQGLVPYFKDVETVVLEGWGESLLHRNLLETIRLVKDEGARAGFVTSGKGLNREYISALVEIGVDFIGISLAGATPATNNAIRVNSDLAEILGHIETFEEIKAQRKTACPQLHLIYLMLKDNIAEVPLLPALARRLGVEEVILTNLIQMTSVWQESQGVFSLTAEPRKEFSVFIEEARIKARECHIRLRTPSLSPQEVAVCAENPLKNLYISTDGEVSPCVYLYPPVRAPLKRIFCGKEHRLQKVSFGNIFREPFGDIWHSRAYREFRECFLARKGVVEEMQARLQSMEGLVDFRAATLPDPPDGCRTCHKILGL